jgi:hypothetical protein
MDRIAAAARLVIATEEAARLADNLSIAGHMDPKTWKAVHAAHMAARDAVVAAFGRTSRPRKAAPEVPDVGAQAEGLT